MERIRIVSTEIWEELNAIKGLSSQDKFFYIYLLTNPNTTQIGIYQITKKQMAFELGYTMEEVCSLMERFEKRYKLIRYNPETREVAIKNWGKDILLEGGKRNMGYISRELEKVEDHSLIPYVADSVDQEEISSLYESFYTH